MTGEWKGLTDLQLSQLQQGGTDVTPRMTLAELMEGATTLGIFTVELEARLAPMVRVTVPEGDMNAERSRRRKERHELQGALRERARVAHDALKFGPTDHHGRFAECTAKPCEQARALTEDS